MIHFSFFFHHSKTCSIFRMTSCSIDREYSCVKLFNIFPILIHSISFPCNITLIAQKVTTVSKAVNMTSWNVHRKVWVTVVVTILLFCIVEKNPPSRAPMKFVFLDFLTFFNFRTRFMSKQNVSDHFQQNFKFLIFSPKKRQSVWGLGGKFWKIFKSPFFSFSQL